MNDGRLEAGEEVRSGRAPSTTARNIPDDVWHKELGMTEGFRCRPEMWPAGAIALNQMIDNMIIGRRNRPAGAPSQAKGRSRLRNKIVFKIASPEGAFMAAKCSRLP